MPERGKLSDYGHFEMNSLQELGSLNRTVPITFYDCSDDQLSKFFDRTSTNFRAIEDNLRCPADNTFLFSGNEKSLISQMLEIKFVRCIENCAPDRDDWIAANTFAVFYNSESFDSHEFKFNGIKGDTGAVINKLNPESPWTVTDFLHLDKVELNDNIVWQTDSTVDTFMRITKGGFLPGLTNEPARVFFQLNLDQIIHTRKVYTFA